MWKSYINCLSSPHFPAQQSGERERDGEKGRGQRTRERKIQRGIKRRQREPEEISKKKCK